MEDLFRSYWWLLFPMGWFIAEAWQNWLSYRARKDALALVQAYAEKGREPPAELIAAINRREELEESARAERAPRINWGWYQAALFGAMAGGLLYISRSGILSDEGLAEALLIVVVVMGALAIASLVYALTWKGPKA
ncbi:MAG: hypothetical protein J0L52_06900 [Caulobacterales bacterium]|nr:hypothetical protein [Caulobacterales bacterium]